MKIAILLAINLAAVFAYSSDRGCHVSEWSSWSRNVHEGLTVATYSLPVTTAMDAGRAHMALNKAHKIAYWKALNACRTDGSCPENINDSEGDALCVDGMADKYPCLGVDLLSLTNRDDLGYYDPMRFDFFNNINDIWGWTDPENGDEYAIVGISGGSSFVRVTDPYNPEVLGFLYSHSQPTLWRDMKTIGNYVYIVADVSNHGVQIVDMTRFRGLTEDDFAFIEPDNHYDGVSNSHNIAGNAEMGYVFPCGLNSICNGGIHMLDVADPLNPFFAGCVDQDGYTHDAECVIYHGPDTRYTDHHICFNYNEDTVTIADITDKSAPIILSKTGYAGSAYTHQGWINEDHTIVVSNDELDEGSFGDSGHTKSFIWDVLDLENPILRNTFYSTETATDHNLYIKGDFVYETNYEAGLRILFLDAENFDLHEVAYFDCFPAGTTTAMNGAWSSYPYFASGNIVVSSMQHGLFIVRPNYEEMYDAVQKIKAQKTTQVRFRQVISNEGGATCPSLVERK